MHEAKTVQCFINLRLKGWSFPPSTPSRRLNMPTASRSGSRRGSRPNCRPLPPEKMAQNGKETVKFLRQTGTPTPRPPPIVNLKSKIVNRKSHHVSLSLATSTRRTLPDFIAFVACLPLKGRRSHRPVATQNGSGIGTDQAGKDL